MGMTGNVLPLLTYQDIGYSFDAVGNVLGYENKAAGYETAQKYTYDGLYQLVKAEGDSIGRSGAGTGLYDYETHYEQAFSFDMIGNMTEKKSRTRSPYANPPGVNLDHESQYTYKQGTHQAIQIGSARYEYDGNGNVILERYGNADTPTGNKKTHEVREEDGVYSTDYGFALTLGSAGSGSANTERRYVWNERNLLKRSSDGQYAVEYRYGADGQRAIKYAVKQGGSGERTETLYYNKWYQLVSTNDNLRMVESKHIYVGETRIATKQRHDDNSNYSEELKHTYYYHGDHLGSAQVVTNGVGEIYEHIEYTPYGELWVDHTKRIGSEEGTPFRFTGKEYDEETGLYYYGARYLDPKTSRWISTDPAMGEYIPGAPINDEAKKRNQNLPGMGGVFNYVNLHVYHYGGNNPVKLIDPDGESSYSAKVKDNCYIFFVEGTVIEGVILGLAGFINGLGIASKAALTATGFKKIEIDAIRASLEQAKSVLSDAAEAIQVASSFAKDLTGTAATIVKGASVIGTLLAAYDTGAALINQERIGADNVINNLWGRQLSAKSHNGVATLYAYALFRFEEMVESGDLEYTVDAFGTARIKFVAGADRVKQELLELRKAMNEDPEWHNGL